MGLTCKSWEPKESSMYAKMDNERMKHSKEVKKIKSEDKKKEKK